MRWLRHDGHGARYVWSGPIRSEQKPDGCAADVGGSTQETAGECLLAQRMWMAIWLLTMMGLLAVERVKIAASEAAQFARSIFE